MIDKVTPNQRKGYAMEQNTEISLQSPSFGTRDTLTPVLREGARRMLAQAIEAEVDACGRACEP